MKHLSQPKHRIKICIKSNSIPKKASFSMFVVKSGMNSGMFAVFFVIEHFLAINLSTKEVLRYEINI